MQVDFSKIKFDEKEFLEALLDEKREKEFFEILKRAD